MVQLSYLLIGLGFLLSLVVQGWLRSTYRRYGRVANSLNLPGARVAALLLDRNDLSHCRLELHPGTLTDHYDPRTKTVRLSERIALEPSVASAAIAAHECGHAIQDATGYGPLRFRSAMLPLAQLGAQYGPWAVMAGYLLAIPTLVHLGFLTFGASLVFQVLSLPVEFNASQRAKRQLQQLVFTATADIEGAERVLRAAAMTYVANAATAMGHMLLVLVIAGRGLFKRWVSPAK
ncbi:MAG: zinc metallopeptidase [Planctomycetota bacterium]